MSSFEDEPLIDSRSPKRSIRGLIAAVSVLSVVVIGLTVALAVVASRSDRVLVHEALGVCPDALAPDVQAMQQEVPIATGAAGRARLREQMGSFQANGIVWLDGQTMASKNGDAGIGLPFYQFSAFAYLTGVDEPNAHFAMPVDTGNPPMLFIEESTYYDAVWGSGRQRSREQVEAEYGLSVWWLSEMAVAMQPWAQAPLYLLNDAAVQPSWSGANASAVDRASLAPALNVARAVKSEAELCVLRAVSAVSSWAHVQVMRNLQPGHSEAQVESMYEYSVRNCLLRQPAYASIVGTGYNSAVLHYTLASDTCENGQILLIDAAGSYRGWTSDITRTLPVSGRFSAEQAAVYDGVLRANERVIAAAESGVHWSTLSGIAAETLVQSAVDAHWLLESAVHNATTVTTMAGVLQPHGLGHHVGLDVHDGAVTPSVLAPGMVFTVEPGWYLNEAVWQACRDSPSKAVHVNWTHVEPLLAAKFGGVRIEDVVEIGADGQAIILSPAPKTRAAIEKEMNH